MAHVGINMYYNTVQLPPTCFV